MVFSLECQSSNETSITLTWHGTSTRYKLEYKQESEQWGARTEYMGCGAPNVFVVEDLKPSSAYIFRLFESVEDGHFGAPGPEVTFHTKKEPRPTTTTTTTMPLQQQDGRASTAETPGGAGAGGINVDGNDLSRPGEVCIARGEGGSGGRSTPPPITGGVNVVGVGGKPADGDGAGAGAGAREGVDSLASTTARLHLRNENDEDGGGSGVGGEGGSEGVSDGGGEHREGHHKSPVGDDGQQRQKVTTYTKPTATVPADSIVAGKRRGPGGSAASVGGAHGSSDGGGGGDEPLPPGWESLVIGGRVVYINHTTRSTTWDRPVALATLPAGSSRRCGSVSAASPTASVASGVGGGEAPLPPGWSAKTPPDGKTNYENLVTKTTTWERSAAPGALAASAVPGKSIGRWDVAKTTRWDAADGETSLPPGWAEVKTQTGQVYYLDHKHKTTSWDRPAAVVSAQVAAPAPPASPVVAAVARDPVLSFTSAYNSIRSVASAGLGSNGGGGELPPWWSTRKTPAGEVYYVSHKDKLTSWDRPVAAPRAAAPPPAAATAPPSVSSKEAPSVSTPANEEPPLRPGWSKKTLPTGQVYYANKDTKATQWNRPSAPHQPQETRSNTGTAVGLTYYEMNASKSTTWDRPVAPAAPPALPRRYSRSTAWVASSDRGQRTRSTGSVPAQSVRPGWMDETGAVAEHSVRPYWMGEKSVRPGWMDEKGSVAEHSVRPGWMGESGSGVGDTEPDDFEARQSAGDESESIRPGWIHDDARSQRLGWLHGAVVASVKGQPGSVSPKSPGGSRIVHGMAAAATATASASFAGLKLTGRAPARQQGTRGRRDVQQRSGEGWRSASRIGADAVVSETVQALSSAEKAEALQADAAARLRRLKEERSSRIRRQKEQRSSEERPHRPREPEGADSTLTIIAEEAENVADGAPLQKVILAKSLGSDPVVYVSTSHGVELEVQPDSLSEEVHLPVEVSPRLQFVECHTEGPDRAPSHEGGSKEEFLAMTFVHGPEEASFRDEKPAKLRFFLGYVDEFAPGDGSNQEVDDKDIERHVLETYRPLTSPDGVKDWKVLGHYSVLFPPPALGDREVWVEVALNHFCTVANGVRTAIVPNIPGYNNDKPSDRPYYTGDFGGLFGMLRRRLKGKAVPPMVRFGNATQEYATFTYYPRIEQTTIGQGREAFGEVGFGGVSVGAGSGKEGLTEGFTLQAARRPITEIVRAGTYQDVEMPCGLSTHPQINVRVGVLENLTGTSVRKSMGTVQVLDEKLISGNKILVLRPPRLEMPCELSELRWPCTAVDIMHHASVIISAAPVV